MKNNIFIYITIFFLFFFNSAKSQDAFNFDVTEAEILDNGNTFIGSKRGIAKTNEGTSLEADYFKYDKLSNILFASGNVIINDEFNKVKIYSEDITYNKNEEIIFTQTRSKATNEETIIEGDKFKYNKRLNKLIATGNVGIKNKVKNYSITTEKINYKILEKKAYTEGNTEAFILSKYTFKSKDVTFFEDEMRFISNNKSTVLDSNSNFYELDEFDFLANEELLKGKNILIITNYLKPKSDKIYLSNGIFNFNLKKFVSKETKILLHQELFDNERKIDENAKDLEKKRVEKLKGKNNPRIYGVSAKGDGDKTIINKAIFTSCKKNDNCPPWSLNANKITHDKKKQNISYNDAILKIYDFPVFYFPKFFHPDPSVDRRSGLLQPRLNSSSIVGTSFNQPYFHVISESKDITFKPTIFDNRIYMFQGEYRQENEKSSFISDFALTKGYKSELANNRNTMSHLFSKYNLDLDFEKFNSSKLEIFLEKVSMDTYLGIFENALITDKTFQDDLKDHNTMTSGLKLELDNEDYNFTSGFTSYENLQTSKNSDRYQYVLPYYNFSSSLLSNEYGSISFTSSGDNTLKDTNNLKSQILNNLNFQSESKYFDSGFVTNYGIHLKNINTMAKNNSTYKSSPQLQVLNINEFNISYPMIKKNISDNDYLTPKISLRINPSNMKDYSSNNSLITTDNIFSINRLGLSESYESGKTATIGIDYRRENSDNIEKFFEVKLASVFRDTPEYKMPQSSSLQGKYSNLIGSIENKFSENLSFDYNFSLDNDFNSIEHNDLKTEFKTNNFVTEFHFHESNGKVGNSNYLSNETSFNLNDNNSLVFKTRRNRKISLTEYYDFIYEYQNDCLTAAIKYRKTYYQDRDITPKEDLFFTLTLFPLTTIDQKIDKKLYRDDNNDIIWK